MNPWLVFSLILLGIWLAIFLAMPKVRKEMVWVSVATMPFGLTEPLFVPEYWNPPSLFDLAARTGFDIESLVFSFAVGGIASVLYEAAVSVRHERMSMDEKHASRHSSHLLALASPVVVFIALFALTSLNPIYSASIAMAVGGIATMLCRPDLAKKIMVGGVLFLGLYFIFFVSFNLAYPGLVQQVWNLSALSGILIVGVPLEELLFASTFGMLWSGVYEHALWYRLRERSA